jgi:hypothetical protein
MFQFDLEDATGGTLTVTEDPHVASLAVIEYSDKIDYKHKVEQGFHVILRCETNLMPQIRQILTYPFLL